MSAPFLATYEDVLDRLDAFVTRRVGKAEMGTVSQSLIRGCVEAALREIVTVRDWKCLKRIWRVALSGAVNTGTVSYAASGDTYDYEVTLTDSTWPSWAADAEIAIGSTGLVCEVDAVKSPTVLTLKPPRIPVSDVSDQSYTLGRSWYVLPPEFAGAWSPAEKNAWFVGKYVPLEEWYLLTKYRNLTGTVQHWTVGPAPNRYGSLALYVYPWASADSAQDLLMKFRPRNLEVSGKEAWNYAGTVSVEEGSTAVTGADTAFRSLMEGSIIRFSSSATKPTAANGSNPYVFQQSVATVADATTLTLSVAAPTTVSGVKYVVSDPVDLMGHMYDAFLWNCRMQLAYECGMEWPQNVRRQYQMSLNQAKIADSPLKGPQVAGIRQRRPSRLTDCKTRPVDWE